jgi:hypothetical protein
MINEKKFLEQIGFALSMLDSGDPEYKLCALDLIEKEVEAQKQIIKEKMEMEKQ